MKPVLLNELNFTLFAAKTYENPHCMSMEEFHDDLKRFQYIKRLMKKYVVSDEMRARLILNHIVILFNCFGENTTPMLFLKLSGYHEQLVPFLVLISRLPEFVTYDGKVLDTKTVRIDPKVVHDINTSLKE